MAKNQLKKNRKNTLPIKWHHGLGVLISIALITAVTFNYSFYVPRTSATTTTTTWDDSGDFTNNNVTSQGATTLTNATTTSAGKMQLSIIGATSTFSESFSDTTNINTGSSSASISGGSLTAGSSTWTQTDWSGGVGASTSNQYSSSTTITTGSGDFTVSSGGSELFANVSFNTTSTLDSWLGKHPTTITGLKLWIKADAITGVSEGGSVSTWPDSSGNGYDVAQSTGGYQPVFRNSGMNERPAVDFDGSDDSMNNSSVLSNIGNATGTVITVFEPQGDTQYGLTRIGANTNGYGRYAGSGGGYTDDFRASGYRLSDYPAVMPTVGRHMLTVRSGSSDYVAYLDRISQGGSNSPQWGLRSTFEIGIDTFGNPLDGYISELLLFNSSLSDANRHDVENYLGNKYSISTSTIVQTTTKRSGAGSVKVVTDTTSTIELLQYVNLGNTNSYNLVAYAYTDGSEVTSADAQLYFNGTSTATTYTSDAGGWYQLSATITGVNASTTYGVLVKTNKTVYVDDMSLKDATVASSGNLISNIFDTTLSDGGATWGTASWTTTASASTTVKIRTSNNSDMSGATAFSSCNAITSGSDISSNNCVTDGHRYIQYQVTLNDSTTFSDITINFTPSSGSYVGISNTVDSLSTGIAYAVINATSTPGSGSISYYLSNDGGSNFATATVGSLLDFSTASSSLVWKIAITGNATVEEISINYNGYFATGTIQNLKIDAGADAVWSSVSWSATTTTGTAVKFRTRGATEAQGSGALSSASWSPYYSTSSDSATITDENSNSNPTYRYLEVEAFLNSGPRNGSDTPYLNSFSLVYVVNSRPQFDTTYGTSGVTASQITTTTDDNWGKVQVIYSVRDPDTLSGSNTPGVITPSFEYRLNANASWTSITNGYLNSGALSNKNVSEVSYTTPTATVNASNTIAIWNAAAQIGSTYSTTTQVRVTINDNEGANNSTTTISAAFTLDTTPPTATITLDSSQTNNVVTYTLSDNTNISYRFTSSSIATSSNAASWTALNATSTSNATTTFSDLSGAPSEEILYYQIRDIYNNILSSSTVAPGITSANQTSLNLKDISNNTAGEYKTFVSWQAMTATSGVVFSRYDLYRSTSTNTDYGSSAYATVSTASQNYYIDSSVSSGTTYYYKMRIVDSEGDISSFSAESYDTVNGQGGTDTTAPTISSVATSSLQNTSVVVAWTTDELATSSVDFGTSAGSYSSTTVKNTFATSHSVALTGLSANTTYYFRVRSRDISGNTATNNNGGSDYTFTTKGGPVITGVAVKSVTDTTATIRWNTNSASDSRVDYSTSASLASPSSVTSSTLVSGEHELTLTGLSGSTRYYFQVLSTDSDSNITTDANGGNYYSFTTTADVTPPVISSVTVAVRTESGAVITWTTNEPATSQVEYGLTSTSTGNYDSITTLDSTKTINHSVTLSGLTSSTTYYYRVKSADGNPSSATAVSDESNFTTTASGVVVQTVTVTAPGGVGRLEAVKLDNTPPKITNFKIDKISSFSATASFDANEETVGFIDIGETTSYGKVSADYNFKEKHEIKIQNLKMGTTYHARASAVDKGGNSSFSEDVTFKTPYLVEQVKNIVQIEDPEQLQDQVDNLIETLIPSIIPPVIENPEPKVFNVTENSATIQWKTNIESFASLAYAEGQNYKPDTESPYNSEVSRTDVKATDHEFVLEGLKPNTTYHYQLRVFKLPQAVSRSGDLTFTTKASKILPSVSNLTKDSITVSWTSVEPSTSIVEYTNLKTGRIERRTLPEITTVHTVLLDKLDQGTPYKLAVSGISEIGNKVESVKEVTVSTSKDITPPTISSLKVDHSFIPSRNDIIQTIINWKTDEPATTVIEYKEGSNRDNPEFPNKDSISALSTDHIMILTKLRPGQIYQVRVSSIDSAGNIVASPIRTIVTPQQPDSVFNVIINNFEDSFGFIKKLR